MGISNPDVGYRGYWVNDTSIVEDLPENWSTGGWKVVKTGLVLTDISSTSKLRFKVSLRHTIFGKYVDFRVVIGGVTVWEKNHTGAYANYTNDIDVSWRRGDIISCELKADGATGNSKDFKICGYLTPLGLN